MYLEGSDQHRGWFQSSLLESCGTRGRAPFDVVLTHGFTLDENGRKMSKSVGNTVEPQKVMKDSGADILRLWVCATDYADDQRIGPEILKNTIETYRKLRNSIRWMLGTLHHFKPSDAVAPSDMPELERLMLHELAKRAAIVRQAYAEFDYKTVVASLSAFMNTELSAFYFDIRKDALYCDAPSSLARKAALTTIDIICDAILKWLAPVLSFTTDEAWRMYRPDAEPSVHLTLFPTESRTRRSSARCSTLIWPKSASPRARWSPMATRRRTPSRWAMSGASRSWSKRPSAPNARGRGRSCRPWARTPNTRMSRRVTRRRCGSGRRWALPYKPIVVPAKAGTHNPGRSR
jgi:isoleucyl-tRNA synthetase